MINKIWQSISSEITNLSLQEPSFYDLISECYDSSECWGKLSTEEIEYYSACLQNLTTLEVACGTGRLLIPLLQAGCNMYGIEISMPMLVELKSRLSLPDQQRVIQWDALQTPYPVEDESFERVIIPFSTYPIIHNNHIDKLDENKVLHEFYRILRPGGLVILSDPRTYVFDKSGNMSAIAHQELQGRNNKILKGSVKGDELHITVNHQHPKHGEIQEKRTSSYELKSTHLLSKQVIQKQEIVLIRLRDNQILGKEYTSFPIWDIEDYPKLGENAGFEYLKMEETLNFYVTPTVNHIFKKTIS